jgi:hypothetical protein
VRERSGGSRSEGFGGARRSENRGDSFGGDNPRPRRKND